MQTTPNKQWVAPALRDLYTDELLIFVLFPLIEPAKWQVRKSWRDYCASIAIRYRDHRIGTLETMFHLEV